MYWSNHLKKGIGFFRSHQLTKYSTLQARAEERLKGAYDIEQRHE